MMYSCCWSCFNLCCLSWRFPGSECSYGPQKRYCPKEEPCLEKNRYQPPPTYQGQRKPWETELFRAVVRKQELIPTSTLEGLFSSNCFSGLLFGIQLFFKEQQNSSTIRNTENFISKNHTMQTDSRNGLHKKKSKHLIDRLPVNKKTLQNIFEIKSLKTGKRPNTSPSSNPQAWAIKWQAKGLPKRKSGRQWKRLGTGKEALWEWVKKWFESCFKVEFEVVKRVWWLIAMCFYIFYRG